MVTWVIIFVIYFVIGLLLVFAGPAARGRHREQLKHEWDQEHSIWKSKALSLSIALGIFAFWPLFIVWGRRELQSWILAIESRYPNSLPYDVYQQIMARLPRAHRENFQKHLSELDYVVTGFAKSPRGEDVAVAVSGLSVNSSFNRIPFSLIRLLDPDISSWPRATRNWLLGDGESLSLPTEISEWLAHSDDQIWEFSSDNNSWRHLAGQAGLAKVRNRVVIESRVLVLN